MTSFFRMAVALALLEVCRRMILKLGGESTMRAVCRVKAASVRRSLLVVEVPLALCSAGLPVEAKARCSEALLALAPASRPFCCPRVRKPRHRRGLHLAFR